MKKLFKNIFLIAFGAIALVSCNENDPNDGHFSADERSGWIQFPGDLENVTYVMSGLVTEFTIPVSLEAPINDEGLTFTYSITDVQGSTAGYIPQTGTGTVPKDSRLGSIKINIPADQLTSCKEFVVTLTGTSRSNVQTGLNNGTEKLLTHRVVIGKGISTYVGNYSVVEGTYMYNTEIIAGNAANEIIIKGFSDFNPASETSIFFTPVSTVYPFVDFGPTTTYLFTDPSAGNIFVGNVGHDVGDGTGQEPAEDHFPAHISTYDPCTSGLSIYFGLFDSTGANLDELRDVFTKLP